MISTHLIEAPVAWMPYLMTGDESDLEHSEITACGVWIEHNRVDSVIDAHNPRDNGREHVCDYECTVHAVYTVQDRDGDFLPVDFVSVIDAIAYATHLAELGADVEVI